MNVNWETIFNAFQKVNVIINIKFGMKPPLNQYLSPAQRDGFLYLIEEFSPAQNIRLRIVFIPIECAELALVDTDIGVIDIAVNDE